MRVTGIGDFGQFGEADSEFRCYTEMKDLDFKQDLVPLNDFNA